MVEAAKQVGRAALDLLTPAARKIRDEQQKKQAEAFERRTKDLRLLLSTDWGRRIAHELLARSGKYADTFNGNPVDMARLNGRRGLGLELQRELAKADPEAFLVMLREAMNAGSA